MFRRLWGAGLAGGTAGTRVATYLERSGFWGSPVPGPAPVSEGLIAGTLVATDSGWRAVEDLAPGDLVVTFDHGLRPLRAVSRTALTTPDAASLPAGARPIELPAGALGNRRPLRLLPGQAVLIESDAAEERFGDPFVLVPAAALDGRAGANRVEPAASLAVVFLEFETDEIVYAEGMALMFCPRRAPALVAGIDELMATGSPRQYPMLPPQVARSLLAA